MVTSYYIMKLSKTHKNLDLSEHIVLKNKSASEIKHSSCRVCLDEGCVSLLDINCNTLDTLQQLCNIQINKNDDLPKKLCNICYKFLNNTMLFINKAKETEEFLKKSLNKKTKSKEEIHKNNSDLSEPEDYSLSNDIESTVKMELEFGKDSIIKEEKISSSMCDKKLKTKPTVAKRVQCKICKSVVMRSYFKQHMTMHDPNHSKYVCEICGKSYRLICAFYNHRFQHSTDFLHKCQLCPYKARDKALLRNHMKVHIADYKYMCTKCPSRFLFRSNLNRHNMWKHKQKQFSCDTCKRMFHTKLAVQQHHEVDHLGMKNHSCNLCGKAFGYRKAMMKHQRTVHKREKRVYSRMPTYLQYENKN
ncbi:zinc finger protein 567-like [Pieris napi]|uniref:zinc finger protein 567-like n=1 Tax=Pieris napi TaxID=78633 RepID=UPI001FBB1B66|nr:zinc finger protein 567-like [Pieris napi]